MISYGPRRVPACMDPYWFAGAAGTELNPLATTCHLPVRFTQVFTYFPTELGWFPIAFWVKSPRTTAVSPYTWTTRLLSFTDSYFARPERRSDTQVALSN